MTRRGARRGRGGRPGSSFRALSSTPPRTVSFRRRPLSFCCPHRSRFAVVRHSTTDQNPQLQLDALNAAGCARTFTDRASGAKTNRPELAAALDYLRRGDTLCIWRLDRLGRSLPHLIEVANVLTERGVALRSLTEQIDTNSAGGRLVFHIFGALAEFERALIQERTLAGLAAARARGRIGGRPTVMNGPKLRLEQRMINATEPDGRPTYGYDEIAAALRVSRFTVIRHLT